MGCAFWLEGTVSSHSQGGHVQFLLGQCHVALTQHHSLLLVLFLAGLVGGLTHCAGMCGPFVAAQVGKAPLRRLSGAALLPYHAGRMTTYMALGMAAALLSRQIMGSPLQQWMSVAFLTLAGMMFMASALPQAGQALARFRVPGLHRIGDALGRIARPLFHRPQGMDGYLLGVLLGFLPCGLVFAALMVVATTGNPFTAALAMLLFTLGTVPALVLVGLGSGAACRRWPLAAQRAARGVMALNGLNLFVLAGTMIW